MRFILLLLLFLTSNAFAARTETISADCVRIQDGICIDKLEFGYLENASANIQVQIDAKAATLTNSSGLAGQLSDETGSGLAVFGTSPNITTPTGIVKGDVGLGNVDNTSDATKNAASVSLTNKTIDADANTITNIENADIKAAAAIDASKLADGTVSSAELQYINTLSSNAQTQINAKITSPAVLTADVTGVLPNANGGSAKALTSVAGGMVYTDSDSFEVLAAGVANQLLQSNGSSPPTWVTSSAVAPRSEIYVTGGSGHGSTNTKIRRFTTSVVATGTDITNSGDSATLGHSFTITTEGIYSITFCDTRAAGNFYVGLSINSAQLTTNVFQITNANRLVTTLGTAAQTFCVSTTHIFAVSDVVRAHTDGSAAATADDQVSFRIVKVSN